MDPNAIKAKLIKSALGAEAICPLCREALAVEVRGHCPACKTAYHRACFAEFGGCSTLGCAAYRQPMKGAGPRPTRACAACWEEDSNLSACPECEIPIHADCLDQEGCGTEGCQLERPRLRRTRRASEVATSLSGATTDAIACGTLAAIAIVVLTAGAQIFLGQEWAKITAFTMIGTAVFVLLSFLERARSGSD